MKLKKCLPEIIYSLITNPELKIMSSTNFETSNLNHESVDFYNEHLAFEKNN